MDAAATVCARRGLARTSLEEIAETAGFTKGAVYANFGSRDELLLAMLDERFAERLAALERVFASSEAPEHQARRAGEDFTRVFAADPEWQRLFFELAVHAAADETFRVALVARHRAMRERIAALLERRLAELGIDPPMPVRDITLMAFAMVNGVALEAMLEPGDVPDDLLGRMFALLSPSLER
ncbi:MAG TPA: TetR/AcrR family transcriptional regulator [Capillimicrobium sp.]|nr:TetR/AcrR family transcriptional regulator [Capillimicrobium sp.]